MKKRLFIILILFLATLSNICVAQTIFPFALADKFKSLRDIFSWKNFEMKHNKVEKKKLVNKTKQFKFLTWDNEINFFHVFDINFDSIPDLIYAGRYPGGLEQDNVMIWLNKNNKLELIFKVQGNIVRIEKDSINKSIQLQIIARPCCADQFFVNTIYQLPAKELPCFKINIMKDIDYYGELNSKSFCSAKIDKALYLNGTVFPKESLQPIKTINSKKAFYIFSKPNYITSTEFQKELYVELIWSGGENPAFALYAKDTEIDILSKMTVKDRIYYFVKTKKNSKVLKTYIEDKKISVYGWVRSTDID